MKTSSNPSEKKSLKKPSFLQLALAFVVFCCLAGAIYWYWPKADLPLENPGPSLSEKVDILSIEPSFSTNGLIPENASFTVHTSMATSPLYIQEVVQPTLGDQVTITPKSDTEYVVTTQTALARGSMVAFKHLNKTKIAGWAFQVADGLLLQNRYPADGADAVPLETGIELTFNRPIDPTIVEHIIIEPYFSFSLKIDKNTALILPDQPLQEATTYRITVKETYQNALADALGSDVTTQFTTFNKGTELKTTSMTLEHYRVSDPIAVPLNTYSSKNRVTLKLYKANSFEAYAQAYLDLKLQIRSFKHAYTKMNLNQDDFTMIADNPNSNVLYEYNYQQVAIIPDLSQGHYIALLDDGDNIQVTFLQVSPYVLYYETSGAQDMASTFIWALDGISGEVLKAANVAIYDHPLNSDYSVSPPQNATNYEAVQTDAQGTAIIQADPSQYLMALEAPKMSLLLPQDRFTYYGDYNLHNLAKDTHYNFLYTDRQVYLPGEAVEFFGTLRFEDARAVSEVKATLWVDGHQYSEQDIPIENDHGHYNTYTGTFDLPKSAVSAAQLLIEVDGLVIESQSLTIERFVKPELSITAQAPIMVESGESLKINGQVQFFDLSPAVNYPLEVRHWLESGGAIASDAPAPPPVSTGTDGSFNYEIVPQIQSKTSEPILYALEFSNATAEQAAFSKSVKTAIFPSPVVLNAKIEQDGKANQFTLEVTSHELKMPSPDLISNPYEIYSLLPSDYSGQALAVPLHVEIKENYYISTLVGTQYNPILKIQEPKYQYDYVESLVATFDDQTTSGKYTGHFTSEPGHSYTVEVTSPLADGNLLYAYAYLYNFQRSQEGGYGPDGEPLDPKLANPPTLEGSVTANVGGKFSMQLNLSDKLKAISDATLAKTLFITYHDFYLNHTVIPGLEPQLQAEFSESMAPNLVVKALYFDGHRFQVGEHPETAIVQMNAEDKQLQIQIDTDKPSYKPGDQVVVTLKTLKKGKPLASSGVLNVVDEAYYALYPESIKAYDIYYARRYGTGVTQSFCTSGQYYGLGGAEMGEGGADDLYIRDNFKNTAAFIPFTTDENGGATLTFTMPDNITTWRLTSHALSEGADIGTTTTKRVATMPFYLRLIHANAYTQGDKAKIVVRSGGQELNENAPVTYTLQIDGQVQPQVDAPAFGGKNAYLEVPPLSLGKHQYQIVGKAQVGNVVYTDAIKGDFDIVDSKLAVNAIKNHLISNSSDGSVKFDLTNSQKTTTLMIWHPEMAAIREGLTSLLGLSFDRLEQALAQTIVMYTLNGETSFKDTFDVFIEYNGIKPLQNAEPSLALTAEVASIIAKSPNAPYYSAFAGVINRDFFYNALSGPKTSLLDQLYAYWGLSTLGAPVLYDLNQFDPANLGAQERVILSAAYEALGSYNQAEELAVNAQDLTDLSIHNQLVQAGTLALLGIDESANAYAKVLDTLPKEGQKHTEQLMQVRYLLAANQRIDPIQIQYTVDSITSRASITDDPLTVTILPNQGFTLDKIEASAQGSIEIVEYFEATLKTLNVDKDAAHCRVERQVESTELSLGQKVNVTLDVTSPINTWCSVTETIPTGFTFIAPPLTWYTQKGDQVTFYKYSLDTTQRFLYTLKANQPGQFEFEPSVATTDQVHFTLSESIQLTVTE